MSPMKVGVMGGLFKDFGSTMTKKLMGWTDVGEEGFPFILFFFSHHCRLCFSPQRVVFLSLLGHPHRGDSFVGGVFRTAIVLRALSMMWSRRQPSLAHTLCTTQKK